jgi:recombination protein RecA
MARKKRGETPTTEGESSVVPEGFELPVSRRDLFAELGTEPKGFGKAVDIVERVVAVRTIFPSFNQASKVGGLPVRRMHTIHGPTHGGKSLFVLGLCRSFIDAGHVAAYIDAEHTLERNFVRDTMGSELKDIPNFRVSRPTSYETTIESVDSFLGAVEKMSAKRSDLCSIVIVDTINKLVPERELEKILKAGAVDHKGAKEMAKGHHGRYRASLNQAWLDQLTPKIGRANCAFVIIAQEREDEDTEDWNAESFIIKGGKSLTYDASMVIRVSKGQPTFMGTEKKNELITGFEHRIRIWKSKVGHMEGRHSDAVMYTSNGKKFPTGIDTWRDALEVAENLGIVQRAGSWYSFGGYRAQGADGMLQRLRDNPAAFDSLNTAINEVLDTSRSSQ